MSPRLRSGAPTEPPAWFKEPGRYDPPRGDDLAVTVAWWRRLSKVQALLTLPPAHWESMAENQRRGEIDWWTWEQKKSAGEIEPLEREDPLTASPPTDTFPIPAFPDHPAVRVLREDDLRARAEFTRFPSDLTLAVNLDAPDSEIVEQFKMLLERARLEIPGPTQRRGWGRLNARIAPIHFSNWNNAHVIALAEITWWANGLAARQRPTNSQLLRWAFADAGVLRPAQKFIEAHKVLASAIKSIPALLARIEELEVRREGSTLWRPIGA